LNKKGKQKIIIIINDEEVATIEKNKETNDEKKKIATKMKNKSIAQTKK